MDASAFHLKMAQAQEFLEGAFWKEKKGWKIIEITINYISKYILYNMCVCVCIAVKMWYTDDSTKNKPYIMLHFHYRFSGTTILKL